MSTKINNWLLKSPTQHQTADPKTKDGYTIIEVMLVLALTGLLLVGVIGGTYSSIAAQRYSDSVRSFAEYLRSVYNAVLSPESFGAGNSSSYAILGKVVVFGLDPSDKSSIYSATLVGKTDIPSTAEEDFITELSNADAQIYCGQPSGLSAGQPTSREVFQIPWEAELTRVKDDSIPIPTSAATVLGEDFSGTVIIARSPISGTVHTVYANKTYNLKDQCSASDSAAANALHHDFNDGISNPGDLFKYETVGFCVKSSNSRLYREVRIANDGRNTSAISILNVDDTSDIYGDNTSEITANASNRCN